VLVVVGARAAARAVVVTLLAHNLHQVHQAQTAVVAVEVPVFILLNQVVQEAVVGVGVD
jgi:hypothetical protein